jgi:HAE1 family hydrophobic/amphiphilic exporter-1
MKYDEGMSIKDAALEGARVRLRPILMTSFAFILGCVPLAIASGSGAVARRVMGSGVIGGMLTASFIAIFVVPASFYMFEKLVHRDESAEPAEGTPAEDTPPATGEGGPHA